MTPWVLARPSQFRPVPPPALNSREYATDFNETKAWGAIGSPRRPEDSAVAVFWSGNGTLYWTRVAADLHAFVTGRLMKVPTCLPFCTSPWQTRRLRHGTQSIGTFSGGR